MAFMGYPFNEGWWAREYDGESFVFPQRENNSGKGKRSERVHDVQPSLGNNRR
jgi:hypothetical protein